MLGHSKFSYVVLSWSSTRFLIYINDLPITLSKIATSVIFADDMSIIITSNNKIDFENAL